MPALVAVAQAHALACPRWCALAPAHDLEARDPDGSVFRVHRAYRRGVGEAAIQLRQSVTVHDHGAVAVCPPLVWLGEGSSIVLSPEEARDMAAELLAAADTLDGSGRAHRDER